ncbi:type IV pilus biogenesis protein PilM [Trinickia dinghuensis]|uniref:Pilus assembly protein PilM n=1 Tax=Trinickia dinghuensis TaxID=2291023 RepID=A0A3D8JUL1_9BURK|nr:type IV pilus biogenesis protein PilM [Trinickia dinghuensis]RDU96767.1 pilus assembly protein PilM [Trinickia dinghuensis]
MYVIWVVVALGALTGAYALFGAESAPATQSASAFGLATNMSEYRQALVGFAQANPSFTGSVPIKTLQPYLGPVVANPIWLNYVQPNTNTGYAGSLVIVYASSTAATAVIPAMEQLAQGSAMAGVAAGVSIVSPGNPPVSLPAALANGIADGMPVWMAQAYE